MLIETGQHDQKRAPAILVGKVSKKSVVADQSTSSTDAWSKRYVNQGLPQPNPFARTSTESGPKLEPMDGPTTSRLKDQDAKIDAMSKKIQEIEEASKNAVQQIQKHDQKIGPLQTAVEESNKNQAQGFAIQQASIEASQRASNEQFQLLRETLTKQLKTPKSDRRV